MGPNLQTGPRGFASGQSGNSHLARYEPIGPNIGQPRHPPFSISMHPNLAQPGSDSFDLPGDRQFYNDLEKRKYEKFMQFRM